VKTKNAIKALPNQALKSHKLFNFTASLSPTINNLQKCWLAKNDIYFLSSASIINNKDQY